MDLGLKGLKCLVTGSSRGIGRSIAARFLEEGAVVAITGRDASRLEKTFEELVRIAYTDSLIHISCDFTSYDSVRKLIQSLESTWGKIDILICNVGSGRSVPPLEENIEEWNRVMDVNFFSALTAIYNSLPLLKKSKAGSITFISSICGMEVLGAPIAYSVAKAGINALAANLAAPLGRENLRVNSVSLGNILFPGSVWERKLAENPEGVRAMLDSQVPLARLGSPDEIANVVAFLASPKAGFVTGANFVVDGGQAKRV